MAERPVTLLVKAFSEEKQADEVLKSLKRLDRQGIFNIVNAAVLVRHENGRTSLRETEDVRAGRGALFGALAGGLIGLLGGPAGVIVGAAAGAATGSVAASAIDMGFADQYLKDIQEGLKPGTSAIIALVEHEWVERVIQELDQLEGQLFRQEIKAEIAAQLEATESKGEGEG
jgi:uncharacterized membrane protein